MENAGGCGLDGGLVAQEVPGVDYRDYGENRPEPYYIYNRGGDALMYPYPPSLLLRLLSTCEGLAASAAIDVTGRVLKVATVTCYSP